MRHDAEVLAYTLASWQRFQETAPISVTTHEFSMKVLRRGRSQQLPSHCHCEASSKTGNLRVWDEIATSDYRPPRNDSGRFQPSSRNDSGKFRQDARNDSVTGSMKSEGICNGFAAKVQQV